MEDSYTIIKRIDDCWSLDGDTNQICTVTMKDDSLGLVAVSKDVENPQDFNDWLKLNCDPRKNVCQLPSYIFRNTNNL
jgi:hypothetical protein